MIGIVVILVALVCLIFLFPYQPKPTAAPTDTRYNTQMKKLWSVAQTSMKERKPLRAEKALLTILKFDEKNAAAYNRLGILYAKSQKFDDAIECFEIAQSLDNNASSLHNVGLIYLETGAFEKAAMAFRQAITIEGDLPARFIALAKAEEKLGRRKDALEALENAYELDSSTATLRQILALHEAAGDQEAIAATTARIESQLAANAAERQKKAKKPRSTARRTLKRPTTRAPKTAARPTVKRTSRSTSAASTARITTQAATTPSARAARLAPAQPRSASRSAASQRPAHPTVASSRIVTKPKTRPTKRKVI